MNPAAAVFLFSFLTIGCLRCETPASTSTTTTAATSVVTPAVLPKTTPPSLSSFTTTTTTTAKATTTTTTSSSTTTSGYGDVMAVTVARSNKIDKDASSSSGELGEDEDSESGPLVIFSNRHEIRSVDLRTHTARSLISGLKNTIALDFYHARSSTHKKQHPFNNQSRSSNSPSTTTLRPPIVMSTLVPSWDDMKPGSVREEDDDRDMIFWTDVLDDKIYRGTIVHGSLTNIEVVIESGLATAEGLAVDWIGKNLYWVESNLDQIEVCKLNGSYRRTLIAGNMEAPRAIALDPRYGLMFWSDWDSEAPRIESASMAGSDRRAVYFVDKRDGAWPNGLTLDYEAMRVYWLDARSDSIHSVKYDGTDAKDVLRGHELLTHPFAISLFESYVYWTDWRTNSVIRANKYNGSDIRIIQKAMSQPFDVKIYHPSRQPVVLLNGSVVRSPCSESSNGGCSHLCLIDLNQEYRCKCPHVMKLDTDGMTCIPHEIVLLLSKPNEIRGVDLEMPAFNVIPPITLPKVIQAGEIDFDASEKRIYWTDFQMNEVKRANLTGNTVDSLIDTVIEHPHGFAIDWISRNMFISSQEITGAARIYVCNLRGEFIFDLIKDGLTNPRSLAVDPIRGILFWSDHGNEDVDDIFNVTTTPAPREKEAYIAASAMDGSNRRIITSLNKNRYLDKPSSLHMDLQSNRLYWVNTGSATIQFIDLETLNITTIWDDARRSGDQPALEPHTIALHEDKILFSSHFANSTFIMDKNDGSGRVVLKNHTDDVSYLKVYDGTVQSGNQTNACSVNNGNCEHLCLPSGNDTRVCKCAISFSNDPKNSSKCVGPDVFLMYSWNYGIKGSPVDPDKQISPEQSAMLPPISKILLATRIDFSFKDNLIFWLDSDDGTIASIKRDTTGYRTIVHGLESIEGLAVDWMAGNVYWVDPSYDVIEVARLNGSSRMVIISGDMDKPNSIVVHPIQGFLFWSDAGEPCKIERTRLDGSDRRVLLNDSMSETAITNIAVDLLEEKLYWCDSRSDSIERMDLHGKNREVVVKGDEIIKSPISILIYGNYIYWADTIYKGGSILRMDKDLMSNASTPAVTILNSNMGDHIKDLKVFHERPTTRSNPCATDNGGCYELCLYVGEGVRRCACSHGKLAPDGQNCEPYDAFIMFSRVLEIDSIHIGDAADLNSPLAIISNKEYMRNVIGLTFDFLNKKVIYSDIQKGSINSVFFNGSDHTVLIEKQGSVEGLVYDQIYSTLYWTSNSESSISRMNMRTDTSNQVPEKIIKLSLDDKPRGIAVDSCASKVYWTNWNTKQPSIQRAYLSGFDIESIILTDIKMPNAITLDHTIQQLFWSDARLDKIERCNLDGTKRHILLRDTPQHPFDIATYDRFIFWTDWVAHAIYRADKITGGDVLMLRRNVPRPMGIIAVANDTEDCTLNPCLSANSGCSELCTVNLNSSVTCSCHPGRVLMEDGKRCAVRKANCSELEFECSNGACIPFEMTCDGVTACSDSSDESIDLCSRDRSCPPQFFKCPNDRCIHTSKICDGIKNCPDSSDELNCTCGTDKFRCSDGRCIGMTYRCDSDPDCPDASDEMGCAAPDCSVHPLFWDTERRFVNCANTTACIHPDWICDGQNDCWDNSDEKDCPIGNRTTDAPCPFACASGLCIPLTWRCDREDDCNDGKNGSASADEADCDYGCTSDQFKCNNMDCIPMLWRCDGHDDCIDRSDETSDCATRECGSGFFKCEATGRCIPNLWVCDGENDCGDARASDEHPSSGCNITSCKATEFRCKNFQCITGSFYCDGDDDCGDLSDEPATCVHAKCTADQFSCLNKRCINSNWTCNNIDDCGDGSDENEITCPNKTKVIQVPANKCGSDDLFECENKACVNVMKLCDGQNDCGDYSDESRCNVNECSSGFACAQACTDLPIGYKCSCFDGFEEFDSGHLCKDIDECHVEKPCSQYCRNTYGSYVCKCAEGYVEYNAAHSCLISSTIQPILIFSNRYFIRQVDLKGHDSQLRVRNLTNAVALDFDWEGKCIYWSDVNAFGSTIKRSCEINPDTSKFPASANGPYEQVLHAATLQSPDGISVDWIGRNIYWCDKGKDTIEVSKLDGTYRKVLIKESLEEPRAIVIDPFQGNLYWSDWGERAYIGKAAMDGSEPTKLITESLGWPNALAIDYVTRELFWADAREDYIACSDLLGKNRWMIASRKANMVPNESPIVSSLHHIFAIAVFEDYIYWSDWESKRIEKCHKYKCKNSTKILQVSHRPMDLQACLFIDSSPTPLLLIIPHL